MDLDIAGSENSLLYTSTAQEQVELPWFEDDWGQTTIQQKISRDYITNENDALVDFPANVQGVYSIVNRAKNNSWGVPRGYAIHPGDSPIRNVSVVHRRLLSGPPAQSAANAWAVKTYLLFADRSRVQTPSQERQLGAIQLGGIEEEGRGTVLQ